MSFLEKKHISNGRTDYSICAPPLVVVLFVFCLVWNCKHAHFSSLILPVLKIVIVNIFGKHQ